MSHTGEDKGDMTTKCRVVFLNRKRTRMKKTDKKKQIKREKPPRKESWFPYFVSKWNWPPNDICKSLEDSTSRMFYPSVEDTSPWNSEWGRGPFLRWLRGPLCRLCTSMWQVPSGGWGWGWGEAQTITTLYREGRWVLMCLSGLWEFVARNEEFRADNCCGQPCCFFPIQRLPV